MTRIPPSLEVVRHDVRTSFAAVDRAEPDELVAAAARSLLAVLGLGAHDVSESELADANDTLAAAVERLQRSVG